MIAPAIIKRQEATTLRVKESYKIAKGITLFGKEEKSSQEKKQNIPSVEIKDDFKIITSFDQKPHLGESSEISNFPRTLQNLIEQKGSSLSLKLCEQLVRELRNTLARTLTLEDIEMAADVFVKQESSII